jgi:hypothetical protein
MGGAYDTYGTQIHAGFMVWKSEEKRPLGRPKGRFRDNIKVSFK